MTAAFQLEGAELWRGGARVLGPLDLALAGGGVTAILGANGAGKSLLLRLLHGLAAPERGRVLCGGEPVEAARRSQSFVFQTPPLLRRSVRANVAFALIAQGAPKAARQDKVDAALRRARLERRAGQPAASLSGGERQRLALARAWATGPKTLLLDEPTASLDPASTAEVERMLAEFRGEGAHLLLATHDLGQARRLADEVVFLSGGRVVEHAPAATFFAAPQTEAARRHLAGELPI